MTTLKSFIRRTGRRFGLDIRRYRPEEAQFVAMLSAHRVNLVFDIGANVGQFGRSLRDAGYRGRIVSFEPLSVAWEKLVVASRSDSLWEVAPRAAIGNEDGEVEMHVSGNSVSSSVLDMLDAHAIAAPGSAYVGREKVPLRRLDTVAVDYLRPDSLLVIKIDTQGYEDRVLRGASNLLKNTVGLRLECSLVPLYDGQLLYDEMIGRLKELGFALWRMTPEFVDPASGRLLQIEATFFR